MNSKAKLGVIISIVLMLVVLGFAFYSQKQSNDNKPETVNRIDNHLTEAESNIYKTRLSDLQTQLENAKTNEDKFGIYMQIGFNQAGWGDLEASKNAFAEAIKLKPNDYNAYAALFQTQVDMNNLDGASGSIQKAIELNPVSADLWRKYIQLKSDKLNASNTELNDLYVQALLKTSNSVDIMTVYAMFLEKSGNLQAAKEYWQKAIAANPTNKKIYQAQVDRIDKLIKQLPK